MRFGRDLVILVSGGETHIGSVAVSNKARSGEIRQLSLLGHREEVIVSQAAEVLKEVVPGEIMVVGGIHYDDINKEQIDEINENCCQLLDQVVDRLSKNGGYFPASPNSLDHRRS